MTITRHTAADLFLLLFASLICGLIISCVFAVLKASPSALTACKYSRFPKYKYFMAELKDCVNGKISLAFTDAICSLLFAIGLLTVSFVFNSGNFRLSSVAVLLLGFFLCISVFGKLFKNILSNILFVLKWMFGIILFPFDWILKRITLLCSRIYKKISNRQNKRLSEKYTAQRLSTIDKTTEFGLIEKYYKEFLK